MANEIRLRSNNISGTITDNPLAIGATTINSAGFVDLPVVDATNHLMLILDPLEVGGTAEIVKVTAHTAASTSVTVQRGQDGSVARSMVFGTTWFHGPVASDYNFTDVAALSTNRPASPFLGQMIYETDTDSISMRSAGPVWQSVMAPLGQWTSWTPTLTALSGGTAVARYQKHGRTVHYRFTYTLAGAGVSGGPTFTLPFAAHADYVANSPMGHAILLDTGVKLYIGIAGIINSTTVFIANFNTAGNEGTPQTLSSTIPFTWGAGDILQVTGTYEAAS